MRRSTPSAMTTNAISKHEADARDRFDRWSQARTFLRLGTWLGYVQREVLSRIDWVHAERLLDVGCGSGLAVYEAARRLQLSGGGIACGCDISEGMLRQRAQPAADLANACFVAASAQSLPFKGELFDVAICTAAFHHFPKPIDALQEVRRVLRPGGKLLIAETCRDRSIVTWIFDRLHRWFEKGHVQYYRMGQLYSLLRDAGFDQVELTEINPSYAETKKLARKVAIFSATAP